MDYFKINQRLEIKNNWSSVLKKSDSRVKMYEIELNIGFNLCFTTVHPQKWKILTYTFSLVFNHLQI